LITEHEEILQSAINELRKQGFRIIRLDHRIVPDALAIKDKEVIAVESETTYTGIWLTRRKLEDSQYDAEIIVTRPLNAHLFNPEVYYEVLRLMREGKSYRETKRFVIEKFQLKSLSVATIHNWLKGKSKPVTLRNVFIS